MPTKTKKKRMRFVLATPICDGHDVAVSAITRLLRAEGVEAVYIGFNKTPIQIVKAALEEDASAIALSSYNGGHMTFFREVLAEQKRQGIAHVPLFCGGGGTILAGEVEPLHKMGVRKVYRPPLDLREAILADPRIEGIQDTTVVLEDDVLTQEITPRLRGTAEGVTLVVPFGTATGGGA